MPAQQGPMLPSLSERVTELFGQHADFVWRSLRRLGVPDAGVDDAVQEVFLVVYRRLDEYEDRGSVRAWLFAISRQVASHFRRGMARTERRHQALIIDTTGCDLDEVMARREAFAMVSDFLEELDEPLRMVFYLADIEGMTVPEIAAALGVKLNTIYGRLRIARKRFEHALAERSASEENTP
jgi:RNA polymerase sigma factor (sigma-70 family)